MSILCRKEVGDIDMMSPYSLNISSLSNDLQEKEKEVYKQVELFLSMRIYGFFSSGRHQGKSSAC